MSPVDAYPHSDASTRINAQSTPATSRHWATKWTWNSRNLLPHVFITGWQCSTEITCRQCNIPAMHIIRTEQLDWKFHQFDEIHVNEYAYHTRRVYIINKPPIATYLCHQNTTSSTDSDKTTEIHNDNYEVDDIESLVRQTTHTALLGSPVFGNVGVQR